METDAFPVASITAVRTGSQLIRSGEDRIVTVLLGMAPVTVKLKFSPEMPTPAMGGGGTTAVTRIVPLGARLDVSL